MLGQVRLSAAREFGGAAAGRACRELTVCATDGEIGQVRGLVVDPGGHQVTHVLLQEGHMWGRKEVAIPIGAVTKIGHFLIYLSLTRRQVKDLPPVGH